MILVAVALTCTSSISSTEQKIKENEEEIISNKKILLEKQEAFINLEINNIELENELNKVKKDKEMMDEYIKLYYNNTDKLKIDIETLEKDVEDLQKVIKVYERYQKTEFQLEYENLEEKIEKLRQRPM